MTDSNYIIKSAMVKSLKPSDDDMKKINKYTLEPLSPDDVFVFKVVMGDNETDDRNYAPFALKAIKDLVRLYVGVTVIKDHHQSSDGQVARVYDCELLESNKRTKSGEPLVSAVAKCYMVRLDSNADLIKELEAGIKKEVSTGCVPKQLICNICGTDQCKSYCSHFAGHTYKDKSGNDVVCQMIIKSVAEAYELSLVAVPAQVRAGTIKSFIKSACQDRSDDKPDKVKESDDVDNTDDDKPEDDKPNTPNKPNPDDSDKPDDEGEGADKDDKSTKLVDDDYYNYVSQRLRTLQTYKFLNMEDVYYE